MNSFNLYSIFWLCPSLRINFSSLCLLLVFSPQRKIQVISWARHQSQIIEGLDLEVLVPFWFMLCNECLELV